MAKSNQSEKYSERLDKAAELLNEMTPDLTKLSESLGKFSGDIFSFSQKMAKELQSSWRASQMADLTLKQYLALLYGTKQTGGNIDDALKSVDALRTFVADQKNRDWLAKRGVHTQDDSGKTLDISQIFSELSQQLEKLPAEQAKELADKVGLSAGTHLSIRQGQAGYQQEYQSMIFQAGYDPQLAEQQTRPFLEAYTRLETLGSVLGNKYGARLAGELTEPVERLTNVVLTNLPEIEAASNSAIERIVGWVNFAIDRLPALIDGIVGVKNVLGGWNHLFTLILSYVAGKWLAGMIGTIFKVYSTSRNLGKAISNLLPDFKKGNGKQGGSGRGHGGRKNRKNKKRGKGAGRRIRSSGLKRTPALKTPAKNSIFSRLLNWGVKGAKSVGNLIKGRGGPIIQGVKRLAPVLGRKLLTGRGLMTALRFIPGPIGFAMNALSLGSMAVDAYKAFFPSDKKTSDETDRLMPQNLDFGLPSVRGRRNVGNALNSGWLASTLGNLGENGLNSASLVCPPQQTVTNNIQQTNQIYISGAQEPKAVANDVADAIFGNASYSIQMLNPRGIG
ncbi:hypothetical protein GIX45_04055 [Erwinia sp. CPCC 100877]|nr:hypothetical protein [Erwinia sp. CPCC 100877]